MLRHLLYWLLCLPLVLAMTLPSAAAGERLHGEESCPFHGEPSMELLSSLDIAIGVELSEEESSGTGCVSPCVNLAGWVSPTSGWLPPSSEALHAPDAAWLSTSPGRLERPPRV
ncbi:hypothetical protein IEI94_08270 [Halomonas sp. ML-15]|uniref:hypothetical protein n=1 Tax=Halomonas sp. ML-15 TaxID=2773305 RepID=UPI001745ECEE|nr:hypothetical protein [Halomonas sp. ML-15]MBD3895841.1 hypothetical protein [Halomonas sp. ML-15]